MSTPTAAACADFLDGGCCDDDDAPRREERGTHTRAGSDRRHNGPRSNVTDEDGACRRPRIGRMMAVLLHKRSNMAQAVVRPPRSTRRRGSKGVCGGGGGGGGGGFTYYMLAMRFFFSFHDPID
jgi:hypothetical protein